MDKTRILIPLLAVGAAPQGCVIAAVGGYYVGKDDHSTEQLAKVAGMPAQVKSLLMVASGGHPRAGYQRGPCSGTVVLKGTVTSGS
jgi:hypothetical protein